MASYLWRKGFFRLTKRENRSEAAHTNMVFKARICKVCGCVLLAVILSLCMNLLSTSDVYAARPNHQGKIVALTFDDGPDPANTPKILGILRRFKVKATFFVVGRETNHYPDLVRREFQQGHMVGNHSYTHRDLTTLSKAEVQRELRKTNLAITATGVRRPKLFRPPYGVTNDAVEGMASSLGMTQTLWAVDAHDRINPPPPEQLCNRVVSGVRPGAIVVMHDGGSVYTDDALGCIIKRLKRKGYAFGQIYPSERYRPLNRSYVEVR